MPVRKSLILEHADNHSFEARNQLNIQYDVTEYLRKMTPLTDSILQCWEARFDKKEHPLVTLYSIMDPN